MALQIYRADQTTTGSMTADRHLYLDDSQQTLVEEGDSRARFLLAAPGHGIPADIVKQLELSVVDGKVVQKGATPAKEEDDDDHVDELPKIADLPSVLAAMTDLDAVTAMAERDTRKTAKPLYDQRLAELTEPK